MANFVQSSHGGQNVSKEPSASCFERSFFRPCQLHRLISPGSSHDTFFEQLLGMEILELGLHFACAVLACNPNNLQFYELYLLMKGYLLLNCRLLEPQVVLSSS